MHIMEPLCEYDFLMVFDSAANSYIL